jgi:hypothetical protein
MSGYQTILRIRRFEEKCAGLGFRLGNPRHGSWGSSEGEDRVAIMPAEGKLPIYIHDAELFTGSISQAELWLQGIEWARSYDMMLRLSDDKKRIKAEDKERERQRVAALKAEQRKAWAVLSDKDVEEIDISMNIVK